MKRHDAVPVALEVNARVAGMPADIRQRVSDSKDEAALANEFVQSWTRERDYALVAGAHGPAARHLVPGPVRRRDQGAFGAGVLNGWTAAGTRPEFKLVTGISTGALIAPFAFLGPAYDDKLKALYTTTSTRDILTTRWYLAAVTNDAMADTLPLRAMLRKHVDRCDARRDRRRVREGAELWIATTNLDARRPLHLEHDAHRRQPGIRRPWTSSTR